MGDCEYTEASALEWRGGDGDGDGDVRMTLVWGRFSQLQGIIDSHS